MYYKFIHGICNTLAGYNVHNLFHFADDVRMHFFNNISAIPLENAMRDLLMKVRKPSMALEQVIRRSFII